MLRGKHRAHIRGRQLRNLNDHNWFTQRSSCMSMMPRHYLCWRRGPLGEGYTVIFGSPFAAVSCITLYAGRHSGGYRRMARVCTCKVSTDTITGKTSLIEGSLFRWGNSCDLSIQSRDQLCPASRGTFVIARSNRGIVCVPCGTARIS